MLGLAKHAIVYFLQRFPMLFYRLGVRTSAVLILICILLIAAAQLCKGKSLQLRFDSSSSDSFQLHVDRGHLSFAASHGASMTPAEVLKTSSSAAKGQTAPIPDFRLAVDFGVCGVHRLQFPDNISFDLIHFSLLVAIPILSGFHFFLQNENRQTFG